MTNYSELSADQLLDLGFRCWNTETQLFLFPYILLEDAKQQDVLFTILEEKIDPKVDKVDDDTRGGLLAYGIVPISLREHSCLY